MLVVVFDGESGAEAGTHVLRQLHLEGEITLYALSVVARGDDGALGVVESGGRGFVGTGLGLAVGSMIGLLGGPAGWALGAVTGAAAGAVRDYWVAGVGLDFVAEAERVLQAGRVAVIAEVEEGWVMPLDDRMLAAGGVVHRRVRAEVAEAQHERDIMVFKAEVAHLLAESEKATGEASARMEAKLAAANAHLVAARGSASARVDELEREGSAKQRAIEEQVAGAEGELKSRLQNRLKEVRHAFDERGLKLRHAWQLAKEALAA